MFSVLIAHPSPDVYGSDRQLVESIAGFRDADWTVTVCLPEDGPLVALLDGVVVRVSGFTVLRKALLSAPGVLRLIAATPGDLYRMVRRIRAVRPNVLYVNTVTVPLWIVAGRLTRTPVLVHVHEAEERAHVAVRIGLTAPLVLAQAIVANSRVTRDVLCGVLPRLAGRIVVIPNGIADHGPASPDDAQVERIVVVGRLSPRKGIDVALDAVGLLRASGRNVVLDVCGTAFPGYEWFERDLRARASAADLSGAVRFLGYVHPTVHVLAAANVALVPSRVEPFGNTAVEALLAERPVVASDVQGLAEIITDGETGLLVPPGDASALAAAIAKVLNDPPLAVELARRGRKMALCRFSVVRYRSEINAVVQAVAGRKTKQMSGAWSR